MKIRSVTDMYQTKTFRKLGQMGKHVQQRKPMMRPVVNRWLNFLFPSYIQVKYADSSKSRTRETYEYIKRYDRVSSEYKITIIFISLMLS